MSMPTRALGRNGPQVTAVGLGLMSLGGIYGSNDTLEHKVAFLEHAHTTGQRFWDTADVYNNSEDAVGEWIKKSGKRNDIFLATKFGLQFSTQIFEIKVRSDPEYVFEACEASLKRLHTNAIDLYYCHRVDGVTPIEKTVEAMVELKRYAMPRPLASTVGYNLHKELDKGRFAIWVFQRSRLPRFVVPMPSTPLPPCR